MTKGLVVCALITAAWGCGNGTLDPGGTAGTMGPGSAGTTGDAGYGPAGTAGASGTGGDIGGTAGGGLPACNTGDGQGDVVEAAIFGPDGTPVAAPVAAPVIVSSIASCATATCPPPATGAASQIVLTGAVGGQDQWSFYLRDTAMPPDIIKVGDQFDLTIDTAVDQTFYRTIDQTVVLARGGNAMVFAASLDQFYKPRLPDLSAFGIAMSDFGAVCQGVPSGCIPRPHEALIARVGTDETIVLGPGQTGLLRQSVSPTPGDFTITVGDFTELADGGGCDAKSPTRLAGFRVP